MPESFPQYTRIDKAEVIRAVVAHNQAVLLLQKSERSKNPNIWEFPGGKIDRIRKLQSTLREQRKTVRKEVSEETGIFLGPRARLLKATEFFAQPFEHNGIIYERRVHVFAIPLRERPMVLVNQTQTADGQPEDNHQGYLWVTKDELIRLRRDNLLSTQSVKFEQALELVGIR